MISITMWTKDISFFFQVVRQAKEEKFLENVCLLLKEKKKKLWAIQREREYRESAAESPKGSRSLRARALSLVHTGQSALSELDGSILGEMK